MSANLIPLTSNGGFSTTGNVVAENVLVIGSIGPSGIASPAPSLNGFDSVNAVTFSATGNVTGGNLIAAGTVSATGNVTADYFFGNIALANGLPATYGNSNVETLLSAFGSNTVSTTGNITTGNLKTSGQIQSTAFTGGNISWSANNQTDFQGAIKVGGTGVIKGPGGASSITLNNNGANIPTLGVTIGTAATSTTTGALIVTGGAGLTGNVYAGGLISATGNITAQNFIGNGAALTNVTVSVAGNVVGTQSNVSIVAGSYTSTFDNTGVATFPGTVNSLGNTNGTAFAVVGNGAAGNVALGFFPTGGTAANLAIRDYSVANSVMYFDTTIGSANTGGQFIFRGSNAFTSYATINSYGVVQPTKPAFRVLGGGVTTPLSTTQNGTGILNGNNWTVDYNQGSYLNTTTGVFTAPVAGLYAVNLVARVVNNSSAQAQICVVKNYATVATNQVMWETAANCTTNHFGVSTISRLAVGDTLILKVTTGTITFDTNDNWSVAFLG